MKNITPSTDQPSPGYAHFPFALLSRRVRLTFSSASPALTVKLSIPFTASLSCAGHALSEPFDRLRFRDVGLQPNLDQAADGLRSV
jgi:hypothetical protein